MMNLHKRLVLERTGPAEAPVGMISLPLPRNDAAQLTIDHPATAAVPVGWWERDRVPRRVISYVIDRDGVPDTLRLTDGPERNEATDSPWSVDARISRENRDFQSHPYDNVEDLRGIPASACLTVEFELLLTYAGRTLRVQFAATSPDGDPHSGIYPWQNVHVDHLWQTPIAQGVRAGGIIYNEDTFLWVDAYLVLFANGVVDVAAHFVNTRLHIEGHDFQGLPVVCFRGDGIAPVEADVPVDGCEFSLGGLTLNVADAAELCSAEHPGRMEAAPEGGALWRPFSRTFHPLLEDTPPNEWEPGAARTVRFQMSLSDARPLIARYRAPSWWYTACGEPWPWGYLPVRGLHWHRSGQMADLIRDGLRRGRFDAGYGSGANYGDAGMGMLQQYYHSGRPEMLDDALAVCYFWADLAVDHCDFSIHQFLGGWPWRTCAYAKFSDPLYGYLETGDPYLLDVAEMCADSYWQWFRANWPRCAVGRDTYPLAGLARTWRMLDDAQARRRSLEMVRMLGGLMQARGTIGGQMGAGPHPGYLPALYMSGVCMMSVLDVAEAVAEKDEHAPAAELSTLLRLLNAEYMSDDRPVLPCHVFRRGGIGDWTLGGHWLAMGHRIFPELARLLEEGESAVAAGLLRCNWDREETHKNWWNHPRSTPRLVPPLYHDALMLGARWTGEGVTMEPIGEAQWWPERQIVHTPVGDLAVLAKCEHGGLRLRFEAPVEFPVEVSYWGWRGGASSTSADGVVIPISGGQSCQRGDRTEAPQTQEE